MNPQISELAEVPPPTGFSDSRLIAALADFKLHERPFQEYWAFSTKPACNPYWPVTVIIAAGLSTPFTVTTTGCTPVGMSDGSTIWTSVVPQTNGCRP